MILCELALVPHSVVQVAVYVPDSDTWIVVPVAVVLQVTVPLHPFAVKVAFSPSQHTVLSVVTTGTLGAVLVPMVIVFELPEVPQLVVHVAVYVPAPTSLLVPVPKPADQLIVPPSQPVAVNLAFSFAHTDDLSVANTGADGA